MIPDNLTLSQAVTVALSRHEFVETLSLVFSMALVVGSFLNEGKRMLLHWISAICLCTVSLEILRYTFWAAHGLLNIDTMALAITIIGIFIYSMGLVVGWSIAHLARKAAIKKAVEVRIRRLNGKDEGNNGDPIEKP